MKEMPPLTDIELNKLLNLRVDWTTKLSDMSSYYVSDLINEFDKDTISDYEALMSEENDLHIKFLQITKFDENDRLLVIEGIEYFKRNQNPNRSAILTSLLVLPKFSFFADNMRDNISRYQNEKTSENYLKNQVDYIIKFIIQGYSIIKYEYILKGYIEILRKELVFFQRDITLNGPIKGRKFRQIAKKISKLSSIEISPQDRLSEVCSNKKLIEALRDEFERLVTPDRKRTLEDRISKIERLEGTGIIKDEKSGSKFFSEGFLYATRGENPLIISLDSFEKNSWASNIEITDDYIKCIKEILNGYASAFHLKYLQDRLKAINVDIPMEEVQDKQRAIPTLKWIGKNNQLYDVIRQLKKKGILLNSYPELALFLKSTIDKLEHTALSTIQKELEKEKRPIKPRRIDLELDDISSEE
jgi:hypothetical protein